MNKIYKLITIFSLVFVLSFVFSDVKTTFGTADYPTMGVTNTVESLDPTKIDNQELAGMNQIKVENGDFESPKVGTSTSVSESNNAWNTTATSGNIRFYPKGTSLDAGNSSSSQIAKIDATNNETPHNAIYQDIDITGVPRDRALNYEVWVQTHAFPGVSGPSKMLYEIGVPGEDTNSNETTTVVSGNKNSQLLNTPAMSRKVYTFKGEIPSDVENTLRVAFAMTQGGAYIDDVKVYVDSPPSFSSTVNIIDNTSTANTVDVSKPVSVEIELARQIDNGDVDWYNQVVTVQIPEGATAPTSAKYSYNGGTQNLPLQITNVTDTTFDIVGFDDTINWYSAKISFNTTLDIDAGPEQMIYANYQYQAAPGIDGNINDYNVWGADLVKAISLYYEATFDANGGTLDPTTTMQVVKVGEFISKPVDPTRDGYTFKGWSTVANGSGTMWNFTSDPMPENHIQLYAIWEPIPPIVNEMNYGDTCIKGTAYPNDIINFYDENDQLIGSTITNENGDFSSCEANSTINIGPGNITIKSEKQDGKLSTPIQMYLVTLDVNGATNSQNTSIYVESGKSAPMTLSPKKDGFNFNGWYDTLENGSKYDFTKVVDSEITLYAQWTEYVGPNVDPMEPGSTCITGTGTPDDIVYFYDENGDVIYQTVVKGDGTYSSCDELGNSNVEIGPGDIEVGTENPDGEISQPTKLHLVTFETNGATNTPTYSIYVQDGDKVLEPINPKKDGFTFNGWTTGVNGGSAFDFNTLITSQVTIYAQWTEYVGPNIDPMEPGSTCITGTGTPNDIVYFYDENGDVIYQTVVKGDGTYSSCDETGNPQIPIGPGDIEIGTENPDGEISKPTMLHLVSFETNGATNTPTYSIYVQDGDKVVEPVNPMKDGFTFNGWTTGVNGGSAFDFNTLITSQVTVYAQWTEYVGPNIDPMEPGDTCITGTGTIGDTVYFYDENGDVIYQTIVKDDGTYSSCDESGNPQIPIGPGDIEVGTENPDGEISLPTKLHLVTFDYNDNLGTPIKQMYVVEGQSITKPSNPINSRFTFEGWSETQAGSSIYDFNTPVDKQVTLYAQWKVYEGVTIDPMIPGDTCITGSGTPGDIVYFYDELGQVIGTTTVDENGTFSSCNSLTNVPIGPGNIEVGAQTPNGEIAVPKILYLVTFDTNGSINTPNQSIYVESGKSVAQPADPIYLGHTFLNWDTEATSKVIFDFSEPIVASTTIYAKWSINNVIVDPMNPGETCLTGSAAPGGTVNIIDNEGNVIGTAVVDENGNFEVCELMPSGDVSIDVTDPQGNTSNPIPLHTVTFDTNDASSLAPGSIYVEEGESFAKPSDPFKDGNIFEFWSVSNDDSEWNFQSDVIGSESITLYVQWTPLIYQLSLDLNGGTSSIYPPQFLEWGTVVSEPVAPFREGYTFSGWNTSADGTGTDVNFGVDTMPAHDVILYAQWTANDYVVSYNVNGGESLDPEDQVVAMDSLITAPTIPTRTGYTFMGWSLDATSTTSMWDFANDTMPDHDITLYAQWGIETYNVTFDVNGGESNAPSKQIVEYNGLVSEPSDPKKTGYEFLGWNMMADGTSTMWDFTTSMMPQNDIVLYAQWELIDYTMSYDTNGADTNVPSSETLHYGDYATEPTEPAKTGYEFLGWNMMRDGLGAFWNFITMTMPDNDVELYADWDITNLIVDPINPGDLCMTGSNGVPGAMIEVTDVFGNIVGTSVVKPDGTWEFCGDVVTDPDDIFVNQVDSEGNVSDKVEVIKPVIYFTVNFNTNGATSVTPSSQSVKIGDRIAEPIDPIKPGYSFDGWYTNDGEVWIFGVDMMPNEDVMLNAHWLINNPIIYPINPGDTCVTGFGAPGSTVYIYDVYGNVISTLVIGEDGTFSYCDASVGEEGEISIELVDPDGNVSNRITVKKPGSGIINALPETGSYPLEMFVLGLSLMYVGMLMSYKFIKR